MTVSRARLTEYARQLDRLVEMACADLASVYREPDTPEEAAAMRDVLIEAVCAISDRYGDMAATLAAERYEELRAEEVGGEYEAALADTYPREKLEGAVRYAAGRFYA